MADTQNFFCSDYARESNVPLMGTATRGDLWFLVEYNKRWGAKAFEESTIPNKVKAHLSGTEARILLIRKGNTKKEDGLRFFIVQAHPQTPKLYEFHLETYTDLLKIDLAKYADGLAGDPNHLRETPLYLICTNGKRDQCCARYGTEIYNAMLEEDEDAVWQSSHIGGHNKAPVTLFFPHGLNYGRTSADAVRHLMREYQSGRVGLENYRGRVCFAPHVQAAEHFWRQQTGILDLPGIQVNAATELNESNWQVTVSSTDGNLRQVFVIQQHLSDFQIPITCLQDKTKPIISFELAK